MAALSEIFSFLDGQRETIIALERLLTSYPALAPESGGIGEIEKAQALEAWLKEQGITNIEHYDAPDSRVPSGIRPNIVATIPGKTNKAPLWIMSHLDVVPEGERSLWQTDPWRVEVKDGKMYGRGVEDNQQGLVSSVVAALALVKLGITPERTVKLLFIADEEVGSTYGIQYLLDHHNLFNKDDLIIIPDGGSADGSEIEVAEKNLCWLKVITKGVQTHAAMPDKGANAFLAASEFAVRVHKLENSAFTARDPLFSPDRTTINPTKKEANVPNINTIPGEDVFYIDMRILPVYPVAKVLDETTKIAHCIEAEHKVKIQLEVVQSNESPPTPANAPVVALLSRAVREVYSVEPKPVGIGGGTVGAYLRKRRSIASCGPR